MYALPNVKDYISWKYFNIEGHWGTCIHCHAVFLLKCNSGDYCSNCDNIDKLGVVT